MMMKFDILTWTNYFVGSFACSFGLFMTGTIISYNNIKKLKWWHYLLLIISSIFIIANSLVFDNVIKILGTLLLLFSLFKIIYHMEIYRSFIISAITYMVFMLSEVIFVLIIILIDYLFNLNLIDNIVKSSFGNIFISFISFSLAYLIRSKIKVFIDKYDKSNLFYIIIVGVITLFTALSSIYKLYISNWNFNYSFVLNIIIAIGSIFLTMILLSQYIKNKDMMEKYQLVEDYLKTSADVVEKYSSTIHKYKNNLIAIKGYLKTDKNRAKEYVDDLLDDYKIKKYSWFSKINYIQIDVFRYLVYYKLTKAEENNLKISIDVSKDLKKINNSILNTNDINIFLEVFGEYFDNAIYASLESFKKEICFVSYIEDEKINFILMNSYEKDIDLNSIVKNGYTTKGKGHGLGLYEIEKVLKGIDYFEHEYSIENNYFVVNFKINLKKIKNHV